MKGNDLYYVSHANVIYGDFSSLVSSSFYPTIQLAGTLDRLKSTGVGLWQVDGINLNSYHGYMHNCTYQNHESFYMKQKFFNVDKETN